MSGSTDFAHNWLAGCSLHMREVTACGGLRSSWRRSSHTGGIAVDDANVYFSADRDTSSSWGGPAGVWSVPIAGGTPTAIAPARGQFGNMLMTVNATAVFHAGTGAITRIAKSDGATRVLAAASPMFIADARGYLYYGDQSGIPRVLEDGSAP